MDADLVQYLEGMEKRQREHFGGRMHGTEKRLREYIDERWHRAETRILRAFGACHESISVRMRKIEADVSNINSSTSQQLDAVQSNGGSPQLFGSTITVRVHTSLRVWAFGFSYTESVIPLTLYCAKGAKRVIRFSLLKT